MKSFLKPLIALAALSLGLESGAEVLVMKDGSRVETRGAFEVKGRRVVFSDSQGKLVALRLDEVDLEASAAASRPAAPPDAAAATANTSAAPKKAPVLVLTDRDVARADPDQPGGAAFAPPRVVMYSTAWCGYCRKARALLAELAVGYTELDVEKSEAAKSARNQLDPNCGVPLIDFGGEIICGFGEARIRQLAKKAAKEAKRAEKLAAEAATGAGGER